MSHVVELTAENFMQEVLTAGVPVLVDFWAPWCGPCLAMAPVLEALASEFAGKMKIAKLNVNNPAHQELAARYHVRGIPNLQVFRNGAVVKELVGFRPQAVLVDELQEVIGAA